MKRTIETPFHHKRFDGIRLENTQPITAGFHSIIIKENDTSDDSRGITQPFFNCWFILKKSFISRLITIPFS